MIGAVTQDHLFKEVSILKLYPFPTELAFLY